MKLEIKKEAEKRTLTRNVVLTDGSTLRQGTKGHMICKDNQHLFKPRGENYAVDIGPLSSKKRW